MTTTDVVALYRTYNRAMAARDTSTLNQILAPSFTLTHMTGYRQARADWLAQIEDGTMGYQASKEKQVNVERVDDTHWHLIGQSLVTAAVYGGATQDWPLTSDMQVVELNQQLQILNVVVTTY
ncbi:nuclear transport factor 2 family protein [Lactiplantibacillus daowaiensis]|uniref:Nuclear transport factor 2 family protein n=1 Tax=Lactiplantibacillus daowaiensis TaxID=2559918 RepID=A0ABW1RYU5_9LACO|nr:nuclear transport factor 2 family protein [Lactiplantibacillus daowaiensis]